MLKKAFLLIFIVLSAIEIKSQNTMSKSSPEAVFREGLELLSREKYSAARQVFERYAATHNDELRAVEAEYYIAYCALNLGNPDAEGLFKDFLSKHPYHTKSSHAYYDLGSYYFQQKKYDRAIDYLEKVNQSSLDIHERLEAKFRLAYSYFNNKQFDNAGPLFNEIKSGNHKYTYAANYYAGYIEFRNGEYDAALTDLHKAEQNEGYKAVVPYLIANVYYKKNAFDELIKYSEDILKNRSDIKNKEEIFLLTAEAYFRKRDYKRSAELFKAYAEKMKPSADVQYRLAFSEYKTQDYKSAIKDFQPIALNKDSLGQSSAYYLGASYLKTNSKEYALAAFDQARRQSFSKDIYEEALFNYGKVNFDLQKYSDAIPALRDFVKLFPRSAHIFEASELLSEAYLRSNNHAEAISYIESLKTKTPRVNAAYQQVTFLRGVELFNDQQFKEAIDLFNKSNNYPLDADIFVQSNFWKGEAESVQKDYPAAIESYHAALGRMEGNNPLFLKANYGLGYAYFNTKEYAKALPYFKRYVNDSPDKQNKDYADALLRLADLNYSQKEYNEALTYYDQALAQQAPDVDYIHYQKGLILSLVDRNAEAVTNLDQVVRDYPSSLYYDDALFIKAQLESNLGQYNEAITDFTKLIDTKQSSSYLPLALNYRAIAYSNLGNHDKAINDYKSLIENYPQHEITDDALEGLLAELNEQDRGEEFEAIKENYIKNNPNNTGALVNINFESAKNLYFAGKYKQAIESFNKYLTTYPESPNNKDVKYFLGDSYYKLNDKENALKYFNEAIAEGSGDFYTKSIQKVAEIRFKEGKFEQAKNNYLVLFRNAKGKRDLYLSWLGLVQSYYNLQKADSVEYYCKEMLAHGNPVPDAENKATLYLGKVAFDRGKYDTATDYFITTFNQAKDENGAEAEYMIALIQYKQEKYKQSLETLFDLNSKFTVYDEWLGKSFLLIAENFVGLNEIFQAKATLHSIIDKSPHQPTVEKAKARLAELEGKEAAR